VVILVPTDVRDAAPLLAELRKVWLPNRVVVVAREGDEELAALVPLVADRTAKGGEATAYVCEGGVCTLPSTEAEDFARALVQ
jgi:hypothetical protein